MLSICTLNLFIVLLDVHAHTCTATEGEYAVGNVVNPKDLGFLLLQQTPVIVIQGGSRKYKPKKKKEVAHTDSENEPFSAIVVIFLSGLHLSLSSVGYFGW